MKSQFKEFITHESIKGLLFGIVMMVVVFLFVHFVLGIQAFS